MTHAKQLAFIHRHDVLALDEHLPGIGLEQADQVLEQNALPAAAAADNHDRFALLDAQVHSLQDWVRAKTLVEISRLDHTF